MSNSYIMYKKINHHSIISAMLCVKFPQVSYLDFSETVHVLKAVAVLTSEHLKLSTVFVVIHLLSAKVTPEWRSNLASPQTSFGVVCHAFISSVTHSFLGRNECVTNEPQRTSAGRLG